MGNAISGGSGNGSAVAQWFNHVINGATLLGISALVGVVWRLSDTVTRIDTFITTKAQQYDRDFARIDTALERHDQRITNLERSEGSREPDAHNRQERQ